MTPTGAEAHAPISRTAKTDGMLLATLAEMANVLLNDHRRPLNPFGILLAAGLTLVFGSISALLASAAQAPMLMLLSSVVAFVAVGVVTLRLRSSAQPLDAAVGAAGAVLIVSSLQLWLTPELSNEVPVRQIAISLVASVLFAFSLAWVGGLLGRRRPPEPSPSRPASVSRLAPERPSASRGLGGQGPISQPAPRSS